MSDEKTVVRVQVTGITRSGTSTASGKPFCMFEAYVFVPPAPYPTKNMFFAETQQQVPQPGMYECDLIPDERAKNFALTVDPRQGRRMSQQPKISAA